MKYRLIISNIKRMSIIQELAVILSQPVNNEADQ